MIKKDIFIGIGILDVSNRLSLEELTKLTIERFPIEKLSVEE